MSPSASQRDSVHVPSTEIFNQGTLRYIKPNLITQSQYPYWEGERRFTPAPPPPGFWNYLKHTRLVSILFLFLMAWTFTRIFVVPVKSHRDYENYLIYSYLNIIIQTLR